MFDIVNLIPSDILDDVLLYGETARQYRVKVIENGVNGYNPNMRSTSAARIHPRLYPEITELLESHIDDGTIVNQFDFLIYNEGDFFKRHKDVYMEPELKDHRIWTTITMLHHSDDLQGGELCIEDCDPISLQQGETVIFKSELEHEAHKVIQGTRKVLVAWLGKYKYT